MWLTLSDMDKYIYHYTNASTLKKYILPTQKLRFRTFEHMNDPKEYKDFPIGAFYSSSTKDDVVDDSILFFSERLKKNWKVACFSADVDGAIVSKVRSDLGEDTVNARYYRGHTRPTMWAHYAGNHSGACLVFKKADLDTQIKLQAQGLQVFSGRVKYVKPSIPSWGASKYIIDITDVNLLGVELALERHILANIDGLFLEKAVDWKSEQEV